MKKKFVYIENDSLDPYFNFGLEYYLTTEKTFDDSTVLLFWRTSPTLMVGKYQNTLQEINQDYVEEKGINVVRRMSGGGTIYTDLGGWQYSFITKGNADQIRFGQYVEPVVQALNDMGIPANFNGRNDLVIGGKKISGNAQYMHNGFVVHHGSLLYGTDLGELVRSTNVADYKVISKGIQSVRDRVTNISDHMKTPISATAFKNLMAESLLGPSGTRHKLTAADTERIKEIASEKFENWNSIYGKNPKFSIIKEGHFAGGTMEFRLDVKKGMITDAGVYGDFFGTVEPQKLSEALIGCPYEKGQLRDRLEDLHFDQFLYKIKIDEIMDTII